MDTGEGEGEHHATGNNISNASELPPSELGTKEYWDKTYESEIDVYSECGVLSDGWFGLSVNRKVLRFLDGLDYPKSSAIVDLGCGNGDTIRELIERGWTNLTGYDYSEKSIALCELSVNSDSDSEKDLSIAFKVVDLVEGDKFDSIFDICLDKGTYDAVSLNPVLSQLESRNKYLRNVHKLLEDNGCFIISSCNWTTDELREHFNKWFVLRAVIPTPQISFGGVSGNTLGMAAFSKKLQSDIQD